MSMKNSDETIGNRNRDLPNCNAVPQPTALPRAPQPVMYFKIFTSSARFPSAIKLHFVQEVLASNLCQEERYRNSSFSYFSSFHPRKWLDYLSQASTSPVHNLSQTINYSLSILTFYIMLSDTDTSQSFPCPHHEGD
jgi:hypothetical protein